MSKYPTKKPDATPYETMCLFCVQKDCIRRDRHPHPNKDKQYLNRCVLAVARHFQLHPAIAADQIRVKRNVLKWQHLEKKCSV